MAFILPEAWYNAEHWVVVAELLQWLPAPYSERKQMLILWAKQSGVGLTKYHYESIARPGEEFTDAGTA